MTATRKAAGLLTGSLLAGRYLLEKPLGSGGMGQVYLARDQSKDSEWVAVKLLKDRDTIEWFKREFETLCLMEHPNIARVFDFARDEEKNVFFYTCEFVDGMPAHTALAGRPFSEKLDCVLQILRALQYIHAQGYLHCDIKPLNVLVTEMNGRLVPKLLDFGLAMAAPRAPEVARGTLCYMAPEWFEGRIPGPWTDIYSAGIMFYELAYGRLPFSADDPTSCMNFHTSGELVFPDDPDVPDWWPQLITRMTVKETADRYRTVKECIAALVRLAGPTLELTPAPAPVEGGIGGPWLGRSAPLALVMDSIRRVARGEGASKMLLVVEGEAGIGRSRFLLEVKRRAQLEGLTVVHLPSPTPTRPGFSTLASSLGHVTGATLAVSAQEQIDHAVVKLAQAALDFAASKPLVILIDDFDRQDEHTLALVSRLLNAGEYRNQSGEPSLPLFIVSTCLAPHDSGLSLSAAPPSSLQSDSSPGGASSIARSDAPPPESSVARAPAVSPADHPLAYRVTLGPLEKAEVGRLLQISLGLPDLPALLVDEVFGSCRGNPKLLHEMALFLRDSGCLEVTPAGVVFHRSRIPGKTLPGNVEHYVRAAWEKFGNEERALLSVLSVLFQPQPLPVLASITRMDTWVVDDLVIDLAQRGILGFVPCEGRELPIVESEALRRMFVAGLSKENLVRLHRTIAQELENQPDSGRTQPDTLAWHWFHAGERKKASRFALDGAARLLSMGSFRQAVELAEIASDTGASRSETNRLFFEIYRLWGKYEEGIAKLEERLRSARQREEKQQITLYLAELRFRAGSFDSALSSLSEMATFGKGKLRGQALALLARVYFYGGKHAQARSTGEQGMLVLPPDSREYALCAAIVGLVRVYEGKLQQGVRYLQAALSVLEKVGAPSDIAFGANAMGLAFHRLKDWNGAVSHYNRSLEVATMAGDAERMTVASTNLAVVHQETGEFAAAIERYESALSMAWQSQNLPVVCRIFNNLGNIHRYLGMLQKARDFAERSIELADRLGLGLSQGLNRMLLGEILSLEGKSDAAREMLERALTHFQEINSADEALECKIDLAELALASQKWNDAAETAEKAAAMARTLKLDNHRLRSLLALAHALLKRDGPGDRGAAAAALDEAVELVDVGNQELEFKLWSLRAQLFTLLGEGEKGTKALQRAEAALSSLRRRIPEEFQPAFFKRPDRKKALEEFGSLSSRMVQFAKTIGPGSHLAEALPTGSQRWVRELIRMNQRLVAQDDIEKLLETLIDVMVDLSGAERGFVILCGSSGLDVVVARNMDREAIRRSRSKFSTTIARKVLEEGKLICLTDAIEADGFRNKKSIMALRIRSVICLPVSSTKGVIGAIYLDNRFKPGVFSDSVVEMLTAFSQQAAIAIENAKLLGDLKSSLEQLELSRREVQQLAAQLEETVRFQKTVIEQKTEELTLRQQQLEEKYQFSNIIGRSPPMKALFSVMTRVKETNVPVLIQGESGSGKELVARAIHFTGPRRAERFVAINCAALPDSLLESELFGYVEGAFTDARREKKGLFALADKGTLFMDEVGDMSLAMQAKLLRVLQEGEFSPLGSEESVRVDVRIITATNKDLKALVASGAFRQDLYYRLDVVSIRVPPLRERKEDIPLLVEHFLAAYAEKNKVAPPRVSLSAMQVLMGYDWPGNVRELESVIMTAAVFAESGVISVDSLRSKPEVFGPGRRGLDPLDSLETLNLREIERRALIAALRKAEGNKMKAARLLGISRRALYNKLDAFGINSRNE